MNTPNSQYIETHGQGMIGPCGLDDARSLAQWISTQRGGIKQCTIVTAELVSEESKRTAKTMKQATEMKW